MNTALAYNTIFKEKFDQLCEAYKSTLYFEDLPEEIPKEYVEDVMLHNGRIVFFKDNILDEYVMLPAGGEHSKDVYGRPTSVSVVGHNGYTKKLEDNFVIIKDNKSCTPPAVTLHNYAHKLALAERVIWLNLNTQKQKTMFKAKKNSGITASILKKMFDNFDPVLVTDKTLDDILTIEPLAISQEYNLDKLYILKDAIENEALEFCGVVNNGVEKKERLTNEEIKTENSKANIKLSDRYFMRKDGIDKVNDMFNLDIKVFTYQDDGGLENDGIEDTEDITEDKDGDSDE